MGVLLTPLIVKETPPLQSLAGRRLAVDAHGEPDDADVVRFL